MTTSDAHRFTIRFPKSMWTALQAHLEDLEKIDGYPTDATTLILKIISFHLKQNKNDSELDRSSELLGSINSNVPDKIKNNDISPTESISSIGDADVLPAGKGNYVIEMAKPISGRVSTKDWVQLERCEDLDRSLQLMRYFCMLFKTNNEHNSDFLACGTSYNIYRVRYNDVTLATQFYTMSKSDQSARDEFFKNNPDIRGRSLCGQSDYHAGKSKMMR